MLISAVVLSSIAVFLLAVTFVILAVMAGKIGRLSEDVSKLVRTVQDEIGPTAREVRSTVSNLDKLTCKAVETVDRVDRVAAGVERLLDGAYVANVAEKLAKTSASGLISVYEGLRQGIRTLRGSKEGVKGGSSDE